MFRRGLDQGDKQRKPGLAQDMFGAAWIWEVTLLGKKVLRQRQEMANANT